jgi:isopentenyldiphosphate isomerase
MSDDELMDVVDEHDAVVATASRRDVHEQLMRHRAVHVIAFDTEDRMALQLRSAGKSFCPLHWTTTASGHVISGESYEDAARGESAEELGVPLELEFFSKDLYRDIEGKERFLVTFTATHSGPFSPDPQEVERIAFFSMDEIHEMIVRGEKFHPVFLFLLEKRFGMTVRGLQVSK